MTTDLVERLLKDPTQLTLLEAADEIEKLRAALQMLVDEKVEYMTINHLGNPETQHTIRVARAALEGRPFK